jgi:hypothetical protein
MSRAITHRESTGKGLVRGIGIYEPRVLCMTDAPHLPRVYSVWNCMLRRTTTEYIEKNPSYAGLSVADEFHRFSDFAEWMMRQIGWSKEGYQLDKDLLVKGNRVYSPETCVFLPPAVNTVIISRANDRENIPIGIRKYRDGRRYLARIRMGGGMIHLGIFDDSDSAFFAYKEAKEAYIKRLAVQYRSEIDPRAYAAMMAYEVNIED